MGHASPGFHWHGGTLLFGFFATCLLESTAPHGSLVWFSTIWLAEKGEPGFPAWFNSPSAELPFFPFRGPKRAKTGRRVQEKGVLSSPTQWGGPDCTGRGAHGRGRRAFGAHGFLGKWAFAGRPAEGPRSSTAQQKSAFVNRGLAKSSGK